MDTVPERRGPVLGAGLTVHDRLGKDERADRRLVLDRARDADDDDVPDGKRVEEALVPSVA